MNATRIAIAVFWLIAFSLRLSVADVIHYWRFEEGSGGTTADQVGGVHGTLENFGFSVNDRWDANTPNSFVPITGSPNNQSMHFGGGGAFIDITTPQAMTLGTSFTIEYYYNAEMPVIVSGMYGLSVSATHWAALAESQGNLFFGANFQGSLQNAPATLVQLNTWQHFALVKEPGEYSIYIDGQLQYNGMLPDGTDGPYNFGGSVETGDRAIGEGFRGYLDEFRISDTALTPAQFLNAVPEPSSALLLVVGAGLLMRHRIRRRWKP